VIGSLSSTVNILQSCSFFAVVGYRYGYLSAVRCKLFAYGPDDATATPSSLASIQSRIVYPSGASLPGVLEERPLNGVVVVVVVFCSGVCVLRQGLTTLLYRTRTTMNGLGYAWKGLERCFSADVTEKISWMTFCADRTVTFRDDNDPHQLFTCSHSDQSDHKPGKVERTAKWSAKMGKVRENHNQFLQAYDGKTLNFSFPCLSAMAIPQL